MFKVSHSRRTGKHAFSASMNRYLTDVPWRRRPSLFLGSPAPSPDAGSRAEVAGAPRVRYSSTRPVHAVLGRSPTACTRLERLTRSDPDHGLPAQWTCHPRGSTELSQP